MNTYGASHGLKAFGSAVTLGLALACAGCGDSESGSGTGGASAASGSGDGGGKTGGDGGASGSGKGSSSASGTNTTTGSGNHATCEEACSYSFENCPGEFDGTEEQCVSGCNDGQPQACVDCLAESCLAGCFDECIGGGPGPGPSSSSGGDPATSSSDASSTSTGVTECNGGCPDDMGEQGCFGPNDCEGDECFWPNGTFDGYCSKSCSDATDCPSGWSCVNNDQSGNLACEQP